MKEIAIVCASLPEINPGMLSVDQGAYAFFKKHFPGYKLRFLTICPPAPHLLEYLQANLPFSYESILENPDVLSSCDLLVYWGDFLHNHAYKYELANKMIKEGIASSSGTALELIDQCLYLSDREQSRIPPFGVFGNNFFIDLNNSPAIADHQRKVVKLFEKASFLLARDILSAHRISALLQDYETNHLGSDASYLNPFHDLQINDGHSGEVGIFLGRSYKQTGNTLPFLKMLIRAFPSHNFQQFHWLKQNNRHRETVQKKLRIKSSFDAYPNLEAMKNKLRQFDWIITDTYHLALNAWRNGTPCVCIGSAMSPADNTLTDKKKEIFHNMYEANDFYVFFEDIAEKSKLKRRAIKLVKTLNNTHYTENVYTGIKAHAQAAERTLLQSTKHILS